MMDMNNRRLRELVMPKYSVGASGPLKGEVEARLTPSPEAGLRGWGEWAGRREGPYKAML